MKDYLLLIRGGDARMEDLSEQEVAEHMEQWGKYMGNLAESGNLAGGLPLAQDGRIVATNETKEGVVSSDNGETVGGYLMLKANDYNHAVKLAKGCPVFEHNGNIEIREIMPMEM